MLLAVRILHYKSRYHRPRTGEFHRQRHHPLLPPVSHSSTLAKETNMLAKHVLVTPLRHAARTCKNYCPQGGRPAQFLTPPHKALNKSISRTRPSVRRGCRVCLPVFAASTSQSVEILSESRRKLEVEVPASKVQRAFQGIVNQFKKEATALPGFRKDKIPLEVLIGQFGGQKRFKQAVIEDVLYSTIAEAMASQLNALPDSVRITSNIEDLERVFDPAKPLCYTVEFEIVPRVAWHASYKDIEVTLQDTGNLNTDAQAADKLIRQYRKEKGGFTRVVQGRGLQAGDVAIVDLAMHDKNNPQMTVPGVNQVKFSFDTDEDPLKLSERMVGMTPGESRSFEVVLPEDYAIQAWQGKTVVATVKVYDLLAWNLPEFTDEWVKQSFPDSKFEGAEDMRKSLIATTTLQRIKELDRQLEDALASELSSRVKIAELPETLVTMYGARCYENELLTQVQQGLIAEADLEKYTEEAQVKAYVAAQRDQFADMVKANLALEDIFQAEGLALDEAVVDAEVAERRQGMEKQQLQFDEAAVREDVTDMMRNISAMTWLKEHVKREVKPWTPAST